MTEHRVGTQEEWEAERDELLAGEKEHTRRGDELAEKRRALPWVKVEKDYRLETEGGTKPLADLFDGRSRLAIYHFMFGPSYESGCPTCSSMADGFDGLIPHLAARDVSMICVSSAPLEKLSAFRKRMGWDFTWASSHESDFNADIGFSTSEAQMLEQMPALVGVDLEHAESAGMPPIAPRNARETGTDLVSYVREGFGFSVFALEDGTVYKTYATTGRGVEFLMGYYSILDRTPEGRLEGADFQTWIRRHDEY